MYRRSPRSRVRERGFTLLATGVCATALVGALGLAVDLGRLYIARNEVQAFVDSASIDAVMELDGTLAGLQRARDVVASNRNRSHQGTQPFAGTVVEFSTSQTGPWEATPATGTNYLFVRVNARANLDAYFIPIVGGASSSTARTLAVAGQVPKEDFRDGSFPFSPLAHDVLGPHFGLIPGEKYTLRWAANPRLGANVCPGDDGAVWIARAESGGGSERGYIQDSSSALIREAIEGDRQTTPLEVGGTVDMTGGAKQTQRDSLHNRVNQDTNPTAATYADYVASGTGNGRRLIVVPVNTYFPDYRIVGFRGFFLLPVSEYDAGGNTAFCAEYIGAYSQGSKHAGAGAPGAYIPRLLE